MKNYICINGKKAELTEEQMKALGIELPKKNPFSRVNNRQHFYYITNKGKLEYGIEINDFQCTGLYEVANYCTDKALMEQRALHETLNRLLWRYSMKHRVEEERKFAYIIQYSHAVHEYNVVWAHEDNVYIGEITFDTKEIANNAIKEIIEPFMEAHPDFKP